MSMAAFLYFRTFTDAEQGYSIALYVLLNGTIVLFKVWWILLFDYKDSRAAFVVLLFGTAFNVVATVLCGVVTGRSVTGGAVEGWISFGLLALHSLWLLYLTIVSWNWQRALGVGRREARRINVK